MLIPDNRDEFRRHGDPHPYFGPAPSALLEGLAHFPDCEIHILCCSKKRMIAPLQLANGIYYHLLVVPQFGWLRMAYAGCILALRKKLRQIRPDLVHGQGTERYCALAAAFSGIPNLTTIHGNMRAISQTMNAQPFTYHWLAARLEAIALARTGGVICNSAHTEALVRRSAQKTWRVPNALREEFLGTQERVDGAGTPLLLNVGAILPNKRQLELLDAAGALWNAGSRFQIGFIGGLDVRSAYGAGFKARIEAPPMCRFAKYLGTKELPALLASLDSADALVHCAGEEAFGLVVAEALARNLKFFGFGNGGVRDIAAGVEAAELVPDNDWNRLRGAIHRWIESGFPRPSSAASTMKTRYHSSVVAARHREIYREVLGHQPSHEPQ